MRSLGPGQLLLPAHAFVLIFRSDLNAANTEKDQKEELFADSYMSYLLFQTRIYSSVDLTKRRNNGKKSRLVSILWVNRAVN